MDIHWFPLFPWLPSSAVEDCIHRPKFSASRKRGLQGEVAEAELRQSLRSLQTHAQPAQRRRARALAGTQGSVDETRDPKKRHRRHVDIATLTNISKQILSNPKYVCT